MGKVNRIKSIVAVYTSRTLTRSEPDEAAPCSLPDPRRASHLAALALACQDCRSGPYAGRSGNGVAGCSDDDAELAVSMLAATAVGAMRHNSRAGSTGARTARIPNRLPIMQSSLVRVG